MNPSVELTTAPVNGHGSSANAMAHAPPRSEATGLSQALRLAAGPDRCVAEAGTGPVPRLLGENGAGKSTLVKCIMGTYQADTGTVRVGDSAVELKNPRQAHALGLGMVYQHFTLVENMTVVENLVMAREHVPAIIDWKDETEQLRAFMKTMPFQVEPTALVRNLAAGEKQKVEILKQLYLPPQGADPRRADLGADAAGGRRDAGRGARHVHRGPAERADDHAQVPRGDGLLRRGDGAAPGPADRRGAGERPDPKPMAEMMMGTAQLPEQAARDEVARPASRASRAW